MYEQVTGLINNVLLLQSNFGLTKKLEECLGWSNMG